MIKINARATIKMLALFFVLRKMIAIFTVIFKYHQRTHNKEFSTKIVMKTFKIAKLSIAKNMFALTREAGQTTLV